MFISRVHLSFVSFLLPLFGFSQAGIINGTAEVLPSNCVEDRGIIVTLTEGQPPAIVQWMNNTVGVGGILILQDLGISDTISNILAGDYSLVVTNGFGVDTTLYVSVVAPPPLTAQVEIEPEKCFGEATGSILISKIEGGLSPYFTRLDGGVTAEIIFWENLAFGFHTIEVEDSNGCVFTTSVLLPAGIEFQFNVGADTLIVSGDTIRGAISSNQPLKVLDWVPDRQAVFQTAGEYVLFPLFDTRYRVTAVDTNGCKSEDQILVKTQRTRPVYAPNVFAPEDPAAENRFFSLYVGGGVRKIQSLVIGDRSGRIWFEASDIVPNDALNGAWDGRFGGERAPTDVYTWIAKLEYTDGRVETQSGDVLLVR